MLMSCLIDTMKNSVTNTDAVIEKYGLTPDSFIDYLALVGDKSDNIPGMPKCGDKTARAVLDAFKTLKGLKPILMTSARSALPVLKLLPNALLSI